MTTRSLLAAFAGTALAAMLAVSLLLEDGPPVAAPAGPDADAEGERAAASERAAAGAASASSAAAPERSSPSDLTDALATPSHAPRGDASGLPVGADALRELIAEHRAAGAGETIFDGGPRTRGPGLPGAPLEWLPGPGGRLEPWCPGDERVALDDEAKAVADRRGSVVGRLERADREVISGYAYDWQDPSVPLTVALYVDGFLIATVQADGARPGAASDGSLGVDALSRGFAAPAPAALSDGERHVVRAVASTRGDPPRAIELAASPRTVGGNDWARGHLIRADTGAIEGWALDPDHPETPVRVEVSIDGVPVAEALASGPTPERFAPHQRAGHWYRVDLGPGVRRGSYARVLVRDLDEPELARESAGSPQLIDAAEGDEGEEEEPENNLPEGAIAFVDGSRITGWARDVDVGEAPIFVDLFVDGAFVERQRADGRFAALVHVPGIESPDHLFVYEVPASLQDGRTHTFGAWAVNEPEGASRELRGSPTTFRAEPSQPPVGYLDRADHIAIAGWAYDPDLKEAPVDVEVWIDGALWQVLRADRVRPDLVPVVSQEPTHGFHVDAPPSLSDGAFHTVAVLARDPSGGPPQPLHRSPRELGAVRPWLGIDVASRLGAGVRVVRVDPAGPAAMPGAGLEPLQAEDRIVRYGAVEASGDASAFTAWLLTRTIGEAVPLDIDRPIPAPAPPPLALPDQIQAWLQQDPPAPDGRHEVVLAGGLEGSLVFQGGALIEQSWTRPERVSTHVTVAERVVER